MKLRHELKHYINLSDYLSIRSRLCHVAKHDMNANENGEYKIRSVYFDNYNDKVLFEKIIGLNHRIRFYDDDDAFIKLEKKSKINGLCKKVSCPITKDECNKIFAGDIDFLRDSNNHLFNELYVRMNSDLWKPKTVVDYVREAYIYDAGNVRITFDKAVKTGLNCVDIFNPKLPMNDAIDSQFIILEVKYDEFLPELISDLIQVGDRSKTSISKYAMCRMNG